MRGQQAAVGIAGYFVGADVGFEPVAVVQDAGLDAVPSLVVDAVGFAADVIADAGGGQQITFVGGIDKDFSFKPITGEGGDGDDFGTVFFDAFVAVEPRFADYGDVVFFDEVFEDFFSDVGFEHPHGGFVFFVARVVGGFLLTPGFGIVVVAFDALVKFLRESHLRLPFCRCRSSRGRRC